MIYLFLVDKSISLDSFVDKFMASVCCELFANFKQLHGTLLPLSMLSLYYGSLFHFSRLFHLSPDFYFCQSFLDCLQFFKLASFSWKCGFSFVFFFKFCYFLHLFSLYLSFSTYSKCTNIKYVQKLNGNFQRHFTRFSVY